MILDRFIISFALEPVKSVAGLLQLEFFKYMLRSKESGSFAGLLKARGLGRNLDCGEFQMFRSFTTLDIEIAVTRDGHEKEYQVVELLFAYIDPIKQQGTTSGRYQEFIDYTNSRSPPYGSIKNQVGRLVDRLHQTQEFHSVLGYYDHVPFDRESLLSTLDQFNPSKFILYEGKAFNGTFKTEPWYGAKYVSSSFPQEQLKKLRNVTAEDFAIFLPEVREIKSLSQPEKDEFSISDLKMELITQSPTVSIWSSYAKTNEDYIQVEFDFNLPPSPSLTSIELLDCLLTSHVYSIRTELSLKGLSSRFRVRGISIIWDLRAKQETLLKAIVEASKFLRGMHSDTTLIEEGKTSYMDFFDCYWKVPPYIDVYSHIKDLLDAYMWEDFKKEATASGMSSLDFSLKFKQMLCHLNLNIIAVGSLAAQRVDEITHTLVAISTSSPFQKYSLTTNLISVGDFVYVKASNYTSFYAAVVYLDLCNLDDFEGLSLAYFTKMLMKSYFVFQLRTVENLGYYVEADFDENTLGGGIALQVQSDRTAVYLESRIEAFLQGFYQKIKTTPESQLNLTLTSAAMGFSEASLDILGKMSEFLLQIKAGTEQRNKSKSRQSFF
ncbi:metalloprotease [Entomophthora muscae]|uniref:Metalloprotease n=1 Tax=Entomophthora muscae TaxID=34485 RepID=A0ACC2T871_9FUNG|nr:metalloprotease [Entomophthora muscae]